VLILLVILLALLLTPSAAASTEKPMLGFNEDFAGWAHGFTVKQKLRLAERAGGRIIRTNLDWRTVEPRRDRWDEWGWAATEEVYDAARARGMRVILVIGFAPHWARGRRPFGCGPGSGPGQGRCEAPPRGAMVPEWAEFAAEAARRFPEAILEVWNEPNLVAFWRSGPSPRRYARLYVAAERAIHRVNRNIPVLTGGLANTHASHLPSIPPVRFLRRVFTAEPRIGSVADGLSVHAYPGGRDLGPGTRFRRTLTGIRGVRNRFGSSETPLYLTEVGLSRGVPERATPKQQARTLDRIWASAQRMPDVRAVLFHRLLTVWDTTSDSWELGTSWLEPGPFPPPAHPVYCRFARKAGNTYPGCRR
jgi:hypothetical protein